MARARRRLASVLVAAALVGSVLISAPGAGAYSQEGSADCANYFAHWSRNDGGVDWANVASWKKAAVVAGFEKDDEPLDYDGTQLVQVTENAYPNNLAVKWSDDPTDPSGLTNCSTATIWLSTLLSSDPDYWNLARHEMGHWFAAAHAGNNDSFNGDNPPTMKTCLNSVNNENLLDQDAQANWNWLHSSLANRQLHANVGFEQGFKFWGKSNSSAIDVEEETNGGWSNSSHITYKTSDMDPYIYQTIRLWTGNDNDEYKARLNAAEHLDTNSTLVRIRIYRRGVTLQNNYDHGDSCRPNNYSDGLLYLNGSVDLTGWVLMTSSQLTTVNGTGYLGVDTYDPEWVNPPQFDGYDLQVRAYGMAWNPNAQDWARVHFDNIRGEGR